MTSSALSRLLVLAPRTGLLSRLAVPRNGAGACAGNGVDGDRIARSVKISRINLLATPYAPRSSSGLAIGRVAPILSTPASTALFAGGRSGVSRRGAFSLKAYEDGGNVGDTGDDRGNRGSGYRVKSEVGCGGGDPKKWWIWEALCALVRSLMSFAADCLGGVSTYEDSDTCNVDENADQGGNGGSGSKGQVGSGGSSGGGDKSSIWLALLKKLFFLAWSLLCFVWKLFRDSIPLLAFAFCYFKVFVFSPEETPHERAQLERFKRNLDAHLPGGKLLRLLLSDK